MNIAEFGLTVLLIAPYLALGALGFFFLENLVEGIRK